jgi:hypothetical protein
MLNAASELLFDHLKLGVDNCKPGNYLIAKNNYLDLNFSKYKLFFDIFSKFFCTGRVLKRLNVPRGFAFILEYFK